MRATSRFCRVAFSGFFAGISTLAFAPAASAAPLLDGYYGGIDNYNPSPSDRIGDYRFEISSAVVTPIGSTGLSVTINTNFVNHIGEVAGVTLGALFLGDTSDVHLTGASPWGTDTFVGDEGRFKYAVTPDAGGASTVYALNGLSGAASDVQLSNVFGNTTSPASGYSFRQNQAVGVNNNAVPNSDGITASWSMDGSASGTGTTGQLTFIINNVFGPGLLADSFTLAWAMTCANDIILVSTVISHQPPLETPLPATLPLFMGGLGMIGWLSAKRRKKAIVAAGC